MFSAKSSAFLQPKYGLAYFHMSLVGFSKYLLR